MSYDVDGQGNLISKELLNSTRRFLNTSMSLSLNPAKESSPVEKTRFFMDKGVYHPFERNNNVPKPNYRTEPLLECCIDTPKYFEEEQSKPECCSYRRVFK